MPEIVKESGDWAIIARSLLFHSCGKIELSDNIPLSIISRAINGDLYILI